jgi:hypothetical protein
MISVQKGVNEQFGVGPIEVFDSMWDKLSEWGIDDALQIHICYGHHYNNVK